MNKKLETCTTCSMGNNCTFASFDDIAKAAAKEKDKLPDGCQLKDEEKE